MTQTQALVLLFVILPIPVAVGVVAFVSWRSSRLPPPVRTSTILAEGEPARARVLSVRPLGSPVDLRPMVRLALRVEPAAGGEPFDLEVVQSLPRGAARQLRSGDTVEVRLTPDHTAGAVVWSGPGGG